MNNFPDFSPPTDVGFLTTICYFFLQERAPNLDSYPEPLDEVQETTRCREASKYM